MSAIVVWRKKLVSTRETPIWGSFAWCTSHRRVAFWVQPLKTSPLGRHQPVRTVKPRNTSLREFQLCACAERPPRPAREQEPPNDSSLRPVFRPAGFTRSTERADHAEENGAGGGTEARPAAGHRPRRPAGPPTGFLQVGGQS